MGGLICVGALGFSVWVVVKLIGSLAGGSSYDSLLKSGQPARGILLRVDSTSSRSMGSSFPVESRNVTVDVEVAGQPPFELQTLALLPTNLRGAVLPGATVELRVDLAKRGTIAIVGPGAGFDATGLAAVPPGSAS